MTFSQKNTLGHLVVVSAMGRFLCFLLVGFFLPGFVFAGAPGPQVGRLGGTQTGPPSGRQGIGGQQANGGPQSGGRSGSTFQPGGNRRGVKKKFDDVPEESLDDPIFGAIGISNGRTLIDPSDSKSEIRKDDENRRRDKVDARRAILEEEAARAEAERKRLAAERAANLEKRKRAGEILEKRKGKKRLHFVHKKKRRMTEEEKEIMLDRIEDAHSSFSVLFGFFGMTVFAVVLGVFGFVGKTIWDQRKSAIEKEKRQKRYQRKW